MRIWLVTIGEPLPTDGPDERLFRTGILAEQLSNQGHHVTWWTSSFDHVRKRQRSTSDEKIELSDRSSLWLLHANSYSSNVSLPRMLNHRAIARKFRNIADREPKPDIILCSWPTLELCVEAVHLGKRRGVPVVLDIRDMWPDTILDLAPRVLRPAARIALHGAYRDANYAASHAAAIVGPTDKIVDWALGYAGRKRTGWDRTFPMGYRTPAASSCGDAEADEFWKNQGIPDDGSTFVACFFGAIGRHFEFETIVKAARQLGQSNRRIQFVICGDGPNLNSWRRRAADRTNLLLPGWVNAPKIRSLMRRSSVGLAPYYSSWDFKIHIPNKPVEYFSAGLPVVSSLQGELANLLAKQECGLTYPNGSADDLARVLAHCDDHPEMLARMAERAANLYRNSFVAEAVYGEMGEYLCRIAGNARRRQAA